MVNLYYVISMDLLCEESDALEMSLMLKYLAYLKVDKTKEVCSCFG